MELASNFLKSSLNGVKQYRNVLTKKKNTHAIIYMIRCFFVVIDGDSGFSASSNNQPM